MCGLRVAGARSAIWVLTVAGAAGLPAGAGAGPAIGQFEVKTLDSEPGEIEFQSQNAYALGVPRRKTVLENGELEGDDNSQARDRNALELEFGITHSLKTRIGIEYEAERREEFTTLREADGFQDLKLDEYAAEVIWIPIPRKGDGIGLGFVVEYEVPAESGEAKTLIAGPIFEWASGPWQLTLIPTLVQFLGGERNDAGQRDEKIDFAYANHLKYHWSDSIDFALETYGTIERVGGRGRAKRRGRVVRRFRPASHWPGGLLELRSGLGAPRMHLKATTTATMKSPVSLGVGALFGLNSNTPATTLKLSLEVFF
jgi:hypothetical protein